MLYLRKEDYKILADTQVVIRELGEKGVVSEEQMDILQKFCDLLTASEKYTEEYRNKAKKIVQEKRKTDKAYAHTRKTKKSGEKVS